MQILHSLRKHILVVGWNFLKSVSIQKESDVEVANYNDNEINLIRTSLYVCSSYTLKFILFTYFLLLFRNDVAVFRVATHFCAHVSS